MNKINHHFKKKIILFFVRFISSEANRDVLDWSGRKPLDYRKQSTSVSASTYSSKYGHITDIQNNIATVSNEMFGGHDFGNTLKIKRSKRFATMNGVLMRSQSMKGLIKSPPTNTLTLPKRTTYFSPELDQDKRNQKHYRSILFHKKSIPSTKSNI